ncbi:alpha/beta fold hydrolase [Nostoc sp. 'Peltigera membranacea cyanobiont' N6]|uniref:alpha/beta fold hydrolase n=1 Tax=Nostoc sp. 'Peltigera membranacea cyanobiont' N6 TaxID=1261031 RepID=UPI000CF3201F|nr:alpha/beta fold hydrolase [Nostoc sp. 'Peltigera membranacea cyanobiont' N6]AVH68133.1 pimeloyl-ACP methyl ester carboxylesterase [Nostoc sp. 'Peltigera membranacea cyanobiont' N6]
MESKWISHNGVRLFSESVGTPDDPPILLIMGAMASAVWWAEDFCCRLAALGRYVIRYDHRDTGRSTSYEPGRIYYSVEDLADDAFCVLDGYGIQSAHLVGISLGGFLAQLMTLKRPQRVKSLTLIASEPLAQTEPTIPGIDSSVLEYHAKASELDWANREAVIEYQIGAWRLISGSAHAFDESAIRELAGADFDRTPNLKTTFNHALLQGGEKWFNRLHEIAVPTLVIHGTEDCVLPYAHSLALQAEIQDAVLLPLPGTGHELHRNDWFVILEAIEKHTVSQQETA